MTYESVSRAGRPVFGGSEEHSSFHQSSTRTYNETKKESRSIATPCFGEGLVQHTIWAPSLLAGVTHQPSKKFAAKKWPPGIRGKPPGFRLMAAWHIGYVFLRLDT